MPTSSQFKIINSLEQKMYRRWNDVYHLSNADVPFVDQVGMDGSSVVNYRTNGTNLSTPPAPNHSGHEGEFSAMSIPERSMSFGPNDSTGENGAVPKLKEDTCTRDVTTPGGKEEITSKSYPLNILSPRIKRRLYCLGFRGFPGERAGEREPMESVLQQRPGIVIKKSPSNDKVKRDAVDQMSKEMDMKINSDILLDFSCVDPELLVPTALCFDAAELDITHLGLKKALDRILIHCSDVKILKIHYDIRKLKNESAKNLWMIYTDSQLSRNLISGCQLNFGKHGTTQLRRYDDIVLLELKREMRAKAWRDILGKPYCAGRIA